MSFRPLSFNKKFLIEQTALTTMLSTENGIPSTYKSLHKNADRDTTLNLFFLMFHLQWTPDNSNLQGE